MPGPDKTCRSRVGSVAAENLAIVRARPPGSARGRNVKKKLKGLAAVDLATPNLNGYSAPRTGEPARTFAD